MQWNGLLLLLLHTYKPFSQILFSFYGFQTIKVYCVAEIFLFSNSIIDVPFVTNKKMEKQKIYCYCYRYIDVVIKYQINGQKFK